MLYNYVLVSTVQHCELAIYIYPDPLESSSESSSHPYRSSKSARLVPLVIKQLPTNYLLYTRLSIYVNAALSIHSTLSFCGSIPALEGQIF